MSITWGRIKIETEELPALVVNWYKKRKSNHSKEWVEWKEQQQIFEVQNYSEDIWKEREHSEDREDEMKMSRHSHRSTLSQ